MAKRKVDQSAGNFEVDVQEIQASAQPIWEKYPNLIFYALGGAAVLVLAWWGYKTLVVEPKQTEAVNVMWQAQQQFESDSFQLALNGPGGGNPGFLEVINNYGGSKAGNAARYYAGVCYLHLGQFDSAIEQLEAFSPDGDLLPSMKYGVLGDCYAEKDDLSTALKMYEKAANVAENDVLAIYFLKKVGLLNEKQGNKEAAKKAYEAIKYEHASPNSNDWKEIDKYLYRVGGE